MKPALAALSLALCAAAPLAASEVDDRIRDVLGGDPAEYRRVVEGFQAALRAGDGAAAAAYVIYPIEVRSGPTPVVVPDAAAFAANCAAIVTPEVAAAVQDQPWDDVFVRDQGVMLGDGEVWFADACLDEACTQRRFGVITIQ